MTIPNTRPRPQRDALNAAESQQRELHNANPDAYGPLGSMVLAYCTSCRSQPTCDQRGCIKLARQEQRP